LGANSRACGSNKCGCYFRTKLRSPRGVRSGCGSVNQRNLDLCAAGSAGSNQYAQRGADTASSPASISAPQTMAKVCCITVPYRSEKPEVAEARAIPADRFDGDARQAGEAERAN